MPFLECEQARIYYEVHGEGPPVLCFAPGGMLSSMDRWSMMPWHPVDALAREHTVILMDQRNAGRSTALIDSDTGWESYTADQLALLDHLKIERCQLVGCCIGCSFILGMLEAVPERVTSAVLMQPIGASEENREAYQHLFGDWLVTVKDRHPAISDAEWEALYQRMFGGDFVYNTSREFVSSLGLPLLVLMGQDLLHPPAISHEIAQLARRATLVEQWKEPARAEELAATISRFLETHLSAESP